MSMSLPGMAKPHICFVAPYIYPVLVRDHGISIVGGAEVQQAFIIAGLKRLGYAITVLTNDFGQPDDFAVDGITIRKIPGNTGKLPFFRFFYPGLTNIVGCLRKINADLFYQRGASWITGAVSWHATQRDKPFVYAAAHDFDTRKSATHKIFNHFAGWRGLWLYRYGVSRSSAIVVQNPQQQDDGITWLEQPFTLIRSCYQPPGRFELAKPGKPVLWLATLRSWKRPELFIELAQRLPHVQFILAGGPDRGDKGKELYQSIEQSVKGLPNVRLTGFLPYEKADDLFNDVSLFVNTSRSEGFPNTFLQAWARGVPTVSFFDTGARDSHGEIGCVVDDMDAMVKTIRRLYQEPDHWERESQRCRSYFHDNHQIDSVVAKYDHLFTKLMSPSRPN